MWVPGSVPNGTTGAALARGFDQATDEMMRPFFYLPLMHSELLADQDRCVRLHETFGDPERDAPSRYSR
jgi:uncharacterized protein (DUF924 family)